MAKKSQIIWIGKAHVKKVGGGIVGNAEGAEVYMALRCETAEEFEDRARALFRQNRFQVFSVDHIQNEFDVPRDEEDPIAVEKIELFKRLTQGPRFVWSAFYGYGEREEW